VQKYKKPGTVSRPGATIDFEFSKYDDLDGAVKLYPENGATSTPTRAMQK
jgi:hypothetical protein